MNFYGYKRPDGRVGVRNKVLILPASVCASDTTRIISQQVVGSVTFNNQLGCSQVAPDQQFTMDVMAGYAANPNVYGTVVVSLGCENCQMDLVVKAIQERTNKPLKQVIIQEAGGTLKAIDMAVRYAKEMVEEASLLQKEEFPMSELIIGTECGGSDPTSGLAANPLIGQLSDLIVKEGGTSILSETTEFIGAEHLLARRAINKEVHDRIFEIVHRYEDSLRLVGEVFKTYIITERAGELCLIDKHAAHERILFEQLAKDYGNVPAQMLLVPVQVNLTAAEKQAVLQNIDLLTDAGIEVEDFGGATVVVRAVPADVPVDDVEDMIIELAARLIDGARDALREKTEWVLHSIACRAAIKAGDKTGAAEMLALAQHIMDGTIPPFCPHGRPCVLKITRKELEKQFGRLV